MKLIPFRHRDAHVPAPETKQVPVIPAPRGTPHVPPPRVWSLLLPPGFTNNRR